MPDHRDPVDPEERGATVLVVVELRRELLQPLRDLRGAGLGAGGCEQPLDLAQRDREGIDVPAGRVDLERGTGRGGEIEALVERHRAVVAGPDRHALAIQHLGDPVERLETGKDKEKTASKATAPVARVNAEAPAIQGRAIFQHGFELKISGSYGALHDYLARLEKLPWRMFWGRVTLDATQHPRLTLTLVVHTLSLDKTWLTL